MMQNTSLVLPAIKPYKFRKREVAVKNQIRNNDIHLPQIGNCGPKKKNTESVSGYLTKKRQQFSRQYDLHVKEEEVKVLVLRVEREEEQLSRVEKELKDESKKLEEQLQNIKSTSIEWGQRTENEVTKKLEKSREIKRLENLISNLKSEISKMEDSLGEFNIYEKFLLQIFNNSLTSEAQELKAENWSERDPEELFRVFHHIREQNLNILKILIREEQTQADANDHFQWLQNITNNSIGQLEVEETNWKNELDSLNAQIKELETRHKQSQEKSHSDKQLKQRQDFFTNLDKKITEVYNSCTNPDEEQQNLTTLKMLAKLELCLEETMKKVSQLPQDQVQAKQKLCVRKREEFVRRRRLLLLPSSADDCPRCQHRRLLHLPQ